MYTICINKIYKLKKINYDLCSYFLIKYWYKKLTKVKHNFGFQQT